MKRLFAIVFLINISVVNAQVINPTMETGDLRFTENKGQICNQFGRLRPDIIFSGQSRSFNFFLRKNGLSLQLDKISVTDTIDLISNDDKTGIEEYVSHRIDINWLASSPNSSVDRNDVKNDFENFYLAHCPQGVTKVKSYGSIMFHDIYPGISLKYYENYGELEYDFNIEPHADYKNIQMEINGADEISIGEEGQLNIYTPLGIIYENPPIAYQGDNIIISQWKLEGNIVSFVLGDYDQSKSLTIDPVVRLWGTFYGFSSPDNGRFCAVDQKSNIYLVGYANSASNIATSGGHQSLKTGNPPDAYLVKFDSNGTRQWATYYGGWDTDYGLACQVDNFSNVVMVGTTKSDTAIATSGSYQQVRGGEYDAFVVIFDSNGIRQWGTYFGGPEDETYSSCAIDASSNIYLSGTTESDSLISSSGAHQISIDGQNDAYLVKFNKNGAKQWSTYYGGALYEEGYSCATDNSNNVYLTGSSKSDNGIATTGTHQTIRQGHVDAFLVKFNSAGVRQWGTYYGGASPDYGLSCSSDGNQSIIVSGYTYSINSIATVGSHQHAIGGQRDAFLVKFSTSGVRQWGTYYGGNQDDIGLHCHIDSYSNIFLAGSTQSDSGMATRSSHQTSFAGYSDGFLVKFNPNGTREWATYYGGESSEGGYAIATFKNRMYLAGTSSSTTGISTPGSHQEINYGNNDGFLVKFKDCAVETNVMQNALLLTATASPATYQWFDCNNNYSPLGGETSQSYTATANGSYGVSVTQNGCVDTSDCYIITGIGIGENDYGLNPSIYPNPSKGSITIDLGKEYSNVTIWIFNSNGQEITKKTYQSEQFIEQKIDGIPGLYLIRIETLDGIYSRGIIVHHIK